MDIPHDTTETRTQTMWQKLACVCRDLQAVFAIAALVLAGLPYIWPHIRHVVRPELGWGVSVEGGVLGRAYTAITDGFVTAYLDCPNTPSGSIDLQGLVLATNAPPRKTSEWEVVAIASASSDSHISHSAISFPVRKNDSWRVDFDAHDSRTTAPRATIRWTPLEKR